MWLHCSSVVSDPLHDTSSIRIGPDPWPKKALFSAIASAGKVYLKRVYHGTAHLIFHVLPLAENPSCRHTTLASLLSQSSSQTVPHSPDMNNSTRPSQERRLPINLMSPCTAPSVYDRLRIRMF